MLGIADLKEILIAIENGDVLLLFRILVFLSIIYVIFNWSNLRHLRYRYRSISIIVLSVLIAVLWPSKLITVSFFIVFILVLLLGVLMYHSSKKTLWPSSTLLGKAEKDINESSYDAAEGRLSKYRRFLLDPLEKFEWHLLYAKTFSIRGEERKTYEILCGIKSDHLFQNELHKLLIYKAFSLFEMGEIKGAAEILPDIAPENTDLFLQRALLMAFCEETRGKLSDASETLLSAINRNPNFLKSKVIPQIYNNLGRIRKIERNVTDTLLYYKKAVQTAIQLHNKYVLCIAMENVILCHALEKDLPSAELWIEKYNGYIDNNNKRDLLEYNNILIKYYRQIGDREKLLSAIKNKRNSLIEKLTGKEKLVFDISELRTRWDSQFLGPDYLFYIESQFDSYLSCDLKERYYALKEISIVLKRLHEIKNLAPFGTFYDKVINQLRSINPEIDTYLSSLPEYCINEKCFWIREVASLAKNNENHYAFQKIIQMLKDIRDIYYRHDNYIEALRANLDIVDEAVFQKNHTLAWEYIVNTIDELQNFVGHPIEPEIFIRIAAYALSLERQDYALEYFNKFKTSGVSIQHFTPWVQGYYQVLVKELAGH